MTRTYTLTYKLLVLIAFVLFSDFKIVYVYCREFRRKNPIFPLYKDRQLLGEMWRSILKANILMNKIESHTVLAQLLEHACEAEIQIVTPYAGNVSSADTHHGHLKHQRYFLKET